ncbi:hypothetical protein [Rheinheimera sp.]|uniref:hypothetical protein n=1 Tax=Rheinheimera sp. TaxID=1869214 RepID=UPI00404894EE
MKFKALFLISFFALISHVEAAVRLQCDDCSLSQMKYLAQKNGDGEYYIANTSNNILKKYVVIQEQNSETNFNIVREVAVETSVKQEFDSIVTARSQVLAAQRSIPAVPENIIPSAYDLSGSTSNQNSVGEWYVSNQGFSEKAANYIAFGFTFFRGMFDIKLVITVTFSDQSKADFVITGTDAYGRFVLALLSAVDSEGNNIPLSANEFTGTYQYSSGGAGVEGFQRAATRNNIFLSDIGFSGTGGNKGIAITCSKTADGQTKCTKQHFF